ncbi:hypothetical protein NUSPORA_00624 [Nucleospora cyclopteri]
MYLHSKLYKWAENKLVYLEGSSIWLKKGNIKIGNEEKVILVYKTGICSIFGRQALVLSLEDRHLFFL